MASFFAKTSGLFQTKHNKIFKLKNHHFKPWPKMTLLEKVKSSNISAEMQEDYKTACCKYKEISKKKEIQQKM